MARHWPVFGSLEGYQGAWLRPDVIAGLTVWAVLVPESLAYASIAGVPPVVGLYAAAPALIFYALLGSSRHLIVGPMSATAALSAAIIMPLAHGDSARYVVLSTALAICTGVAGVLAALLRIVIRRILYLRTSTQGLHCRPGFDDHHWPSAKTARR
jgi:SulP family sulfate permease